MCVRVCAPWRAIGSPSPCGGRRLSRPCPWHRACCQACWCPCCRCTCCCSLVGGWCLCCRLHVLLLLVALHGGAHYHHCLHITLLLLLLLLPCRMLHTTATTTTRLRPPCRGLLCSVCGCCSRCSGIPGALLAAALLPWCLLLCGATCRLLLLLKRRRRRRSQRVGRHKGPRVCHPGRGCCCCGGIQGLLWQRLAAWPLSCDNPGLCCCWQGLQGQHAGGCLKSGLQLRPQVPDLATGLLQLSAQVTNYRICQAQRQARDALVLLSRLLEASELLLGLLLPLLCCGQLCSAGLCLRLQLLLKACNECPSGVDLCLRQHQLLLEASLLCLCRLVLLPCRGQLCSPGLPLLLQLLLQVKELLPQLCQLCCCGRVHATTTVHSQPAQGRLVAIKLRNSIAELLPCRRGGTCLVVPMAQASAAVVLQGQHRCRAKCSSCPSVALSSRRARQEPTGGWLLLLLLRAATWAHVA